MCHTNSKELKEGRNLGTCSKGRQNTESSVTGPKEKAAANTRTVVKGVNPVLQKGSVYMGGIWGICFNNIPSANLLSGDRISCHFYEVENEN